MDPGQQGPLVCARRQRLGRLRALDGVARRHPQFRWHDAGRSADRSLGCEPRLSLPRRHRRVHRTELVAARAARSRRASRSDRQHAQAGDGVAAVARPRALFPQQVAVPGFRAVPATGLRATHQQDATIGEAGRNGGAIGDFGAVGDAGFIEIAAAEHRIGKGRDHAKHGQSSHRGNRTDGFEFHGAASLILVADDSDCRAGLRPNPAFVTPDNADVSFYINPAPGTRRVFGVGEFMTGSTRTSDGLDARRRRLLFRSWHRGTREADLIMGRFADAYIETLSDAELDQYEHLLEALESDLLAWVTNVMPVPPEHDTAMFCRVRD